MEILSADRGLKYSSRELHVKNFKDMREKYWAYKLRKKIYCDQLGWVASKLNKIEIDIYDEKATLIGVLNNQNEVIGTVRIIPAVQKMMIEKEFSTLVSPVHVIKKNKNAAEISRLCVDYCISPKLKKKVSRALYKSIERWSILHHVRYLYFVITRTMQRNLTLWGYPCHRIGPVTTMQDGTRVVAAMLDWQDYYGKL